MIDRQIQIPGRTSTVINDRIRRNTAIYMVAYYDRISPCRIRRNTVIYGQKNDRLLPSYTAAVYGLRFSPYMIVLFRIRSRRYTIVIRDHVIRQNTVVHGKIRNVHGRLQAYTDSVFVDLHSKQKRNFTEPPKKVRQIWKSLQMCWKFQKKNKKIYETFKDIGGRAHFRNHLLRNLF